jgi:hypothetical protein
MCDVPTGASCVSKHCNECRRRAAAGPHSDPKRGTGRTTRAVKAAVMAAAFGKRVVYLCGNQNSADYACNVANEFIVTALGTITGADGYLLSNRVTCNRSGCTFYFANGEVSGRLEFRSIAAQDINLCLSNKNAYHVIEDHFAVEVRAEQEAKRIRMEDCNTIISLMKKHGMIKVHLPEDANHAPTWVRK